RRRLLAAARQAAGRVGAGLPLQAARRRRSGPRRMSPAIGFSGHRALVTGGASGIGEVTARLLVELGATVVLADLNRDALPAALERTGAVAWTAGDVASEEDAERMVAEAAEAL